MTELKTLPRYLLNSAEIATTADRLLSILKPVLEDNRFIKGLCALMSDHLKAVQEAYGEQVANLLTKPLAQADDGRDTLHGRISKFLRGARFHFEPNKAEAASNLYRIFKNHDLGLSRDSYAVQSNKLNALFSDLEQEDIKKAVATLGMEATFNELRRAEAKFNELYVQKVEAEAEAKEIGPVGVLIPPLRQDLYYVLTMLEIMGRVKPEAYTEVVNNVNELIIEMGSKARSRHNRKEEEDEVGQENE